MFIRGIVVPILVICLILFIGVSYNNANTDTNTNDDNQTSMNGSTNQSGITTTPMINRTGNNNNTNGTGNGNGMGTGTGNNNSDNNNLDANNTLTETQLKNELERINGLGTVYVDIMGDTAYIIKNGEDTLNQSMSIGDVSIRDEIIRTVKNINSNIRRVCVLDNTNVYSSYNTNSPMSNLNTYETTSNVIYVN